MPDPIWIAVALAWVAEALLLGFVMRQRGYDGFSWSLMGIVLGPLVLPIAISFLTRPPTKQPKFLRSGHRGPGRVDVLVGVDGSPHAAAAIEKAVSLFDPSDGRITLARVIALDANVESEKAAEVELTAACADHAELDPSAVVLRGDPTRVLADYARENGYDVLVVGTRGTGRTKALLGSVATGLSRGAGVPVLLVG